jgi:Transposase DNA-binding
VGIGENESMELNVSTQIGTEMEMGDWIDEAQNAATWAQAQWGMCQMGDARLTARAVAMGARMAEHPGWSLPAQQGSGAATQGAYRLLNNGQVTGEALWQPHLEATRQAAGHAGVTLMVQDRTTLDYSAHPATTGLGPVGSRQQRGLLLHSTLAVTAQTRQVLGLAHAQVIQRPERPAPKPSHAQRASGPEGWAWEAAVEAIGPVPVGATWLYVSDRESDIYDYLVACRAAGAGFVVRAFQNRTVQWGPGGRESGKLIQRAHSLLPKSGPRHTYIVTVSATTHASERAAKIVLSWCRLLLPPSACAHGRTSLEVWVVRAWEEAPPPGAKRVEWILLTSQPVTTATAAVQVVEWYTCRWLVEDYHMCLKTGCRVETSQLDAGADLQRLLGFQAPLAVRLLQLRQSVRATPEMLAADAVDPLLVRLLAARLQRPADLSLAQFWQGVAQLGGHLGRKRDGAPGWRTLWRGWLTLQEYAVGARLVLS